MRASPVFNPNQVAFISYLFGETRNPAGKEELLNLTSDDNIRIRAASVNALGKIYIDSLDPEFINKVSRRLSELAAENTPDKIYNKDIAYAFKNYKNFDNIAALIQLMSFNYFGVRFSAAENLKFYGDVYYNFISPDLLKNISQNKIWYQSFLNSITNISQDNFKTLFTDLLLL